MGYIKYIKNVLIFFFFGFVIILFIYLLYDIYLNIIWIGSIFYIRKYLFFFFLFVFIVSE